MADYQKNIVTETPVEQVYAALTEHIADWWSNYLTGAAARVDDHFTIAFGQTKKTFAILEAIPDKKVVWQCTKAYIDMDALKNKEEWVGTKLFWSLSTTGKTTTLNFLHEGLNPTFECYAVCEEGWEMFLSSLEAYLKTGKGQPYLKG